jgi:hypothetical protein
VGGHFHPEDNDEPYYIAKWNASGWSSLESGTDGTVQAIAALGNVVFAGGQFSSASGQANTNCLAEYNPFLTNADLSSLTLSSGTLAPPFAPVTTDYTANVVNSTHTILVTPTALNPNATILVNGTAVASGNASQTIHLDVGENSIDIVVTAEDGVTNKTYSVTVERDAFEVYLPRLTR